MTPGVSSRHHIQDNCRDLHQFSSFQQNVGRSFNNRRIVSVCSTTQWQRFHGVSVAEWRCRCDTCGEPLCTVCRPSRDIHCLGPSLLCHIALTTRSQAVARIPTVLPYSRQSSWLLLVNSISSCFRVIGPRPKPRHTKRFCCLSNATRFIAQMKTYT